MVIYDALRLGNVAKWRITATFVYSANRDLMALKETYPVATSEVTSEAKARTLPSSKGATFRESLSRQ